MSFGRLSVRTPSSHARLLALAAFPVTLSLVLTACGGDDDDSDATEPSDSTNTAGALVLNGEWPLTGEKLEGDLPDHPVYVVKIDNTSSSAPQVGLSSADMVVEELVEGGLARLAVFYYSDTPDQVGPVRSMRASDVGIVQPVNGELVASGAARITLGVLSKAGVPVHTEGATGFSRDSSKSAPYNLFMNLSELADKPGKSWKAPEQAYLTFGDPADFAGNISVKTIDASFSGAHSTNWTYGSNGWTRTDGYADKDFVADNVLLLRVKVGDAGYRDPAGNPVPETYFFGRGQGVLVHGDMAQKVKWTKKGKTGPVVLTTVSGDPVSVPRGHTWIELVPTSTGSVTLGK
jgi:hypothetical protein